ncbi:glycosyltransferase family 9 protein [Fusobacterium sp.]|uniref:glycosyltransferase family 9 protein n=1 Tax=Fusobacterium sp. TaxID=68766 RepID=UPI00396C61D7
MILKKAYIRDLLNTKLINFILYFFKFKHDGKIIVKSMDGIGDILVRSTLAKKIIEKYGKDNVVFLMKENYKILGEMLGYTVIGIPRKSEKNFFKRLKLFYRINKEYSPKKFFNIEFGNDSIVANVNALEKIGVFDDSIMASPYNNYYTEFFYFSSKNEKILKKVKEIGQNILNEKLTEEKILPNLQSVFNTNKEEGIVVAVGSTARNRVCSPLRMQNYIKVLKDFYPTEKILLVGNGELQNKYAQDIISLLPNFEIVNMVDKTSLKEVFEIVASSKFFLGFESGLYNFCFVTRKKGIGLFRDTSVPFAHDVSWIKNVGPSNTKLKDVKDDIYYDSNINNISVDDFRKAVEELI